MVTSTEKRFIPCFICSSAILAVLTSYLSILIRDLGYSPLWVGILLGINSGAGIIGPILLGFWVDKAGNYRAALIVACILPALVIFPMVLWVNPAVSIIVIAFMAVGTRSSVSLIDAITTIQIGKTGNYGRIRVWGSISFILVTLFLQWTPVLKPNNAGNISAWIGITSVISILPILFLPRFFLRSTAEHQHKEPREKMAMPIFSMYVIGGFGVIFLCNFSMAAVYAYFPLYMVEVLKWDMVGLMFALAAASEVPFMFLSAALIRRYGSLPLLALAAVGICLRLLIWAFLPFKPWIIASQLLHALCFGIFHPAAIHFTAGIFPAHKRGIGMSVYTAFGAGLPALIGNIAGGAIIEASGYRFLFTLYACITGVAVLICGTIRLQSLTDKNGISLPRLRQR